MTAFNIPTWLRHNDRRNTSGRISSPLIHKDQIKPAFFLVGYCPFPLETWGRGAVLDRALADAFCNVKRKAIQHPDGKLLG